MAVVAQSANFVGETTNSSGTGTTVALLGAIAGHVTWATRFAVAAPIYYIRWDTAGAFEECLGTLTNSTTITRTSVRASSNGGAAVNWAPAATQNVTCGPGASEVLLRFNAFAEMSAGEKTSAITNLGLGTSAVMAASRFGLLEGQSGGTTGKVVRPTTTASTWTDASQADTAAQLLCLGIKTAEGIYLPGSYVPGLSSLVAGTNYWLSTAGGLTSTAPTPSASLRSVYIGMGITTTALVFRPGVPVGA